MALQLELIQETARFWHIQEALQTVQAVGSTCHIGVRSPALLSTYGGSGRTASFSVTGNAEHSAQSPCAI